MVDSVSSGNDVVYLAVTKWEASVLFPIGNIACVPNVSILA